MGNIVFRYMVLAKSRLLPIWLHAYKNINGCACNKVILKCAAKAYGWDFEMFCDILDEQLMFKEELTKHEKEAAEMYALGAINKDQLLTKPISINKDRINKVLQYASHYYNSYEMYMRKSKNLLNK